jgi:DNA-binding transcriptional ArsR family regulator
MFVTLYARIVYELAANPRIAQEVLARKLDVTIRTMQRHMTELERGGFIVVRRDHKPFTYEVQWHLPVPHFEEMTLAMFRPRDRSTSPPRGGEPSRSRMS